MRMAITDRLDAAQRAELQSRLLLAGKILGGASDEELARHHLALGQIEQAREHATRAANAASAALAFNQAVGLFDFALSLCDGDRAVQSDLQEGLGYALGNAGRGKDAAEALLAASQGAAPARAQTLQQRAAQYLLYSGHVDDALATLRRVLSDAGMPLSKGPRRALASLVWRRSRIKLLGENFKPKAPSEIPPESLEAIDVCWHTATGLLPVDTIHGLNLQSRHLRLAMDAGDSYRMARALAIESSAEATIGYARRTQVRDLLDRAGRLARQVQDPHALGLVDMCAGVSDYLLGRWPQSIEHCDRAERRFTEECTGRAWEMHNSRRFALGSLYYHGRLAELHRRVHLWLNDAIERGDLYASTNIRTGPCNAIWLALDDADTAREEVRAAVREWSQDGYHTQHFYSLYSEVNIDQYAGDARTAWNRISEAWPRLKRSLLLRTQLIRSEIRWLRGRTALALALDDADQKSALLREARRSIAGLAKEGPLYALGLSALLQAELELALDQREDAIAHLRSAEERFDGCGMLHFAQTCRELTCRAGAKRSSDEVAHFFAEQGVVSADKVMALVAPSALNLLA
jgi:tetratricopeptide (TPR) repeat protein